MVRNSDNIVDSYEYRKVHISQKKLTQLSEGDRVLVNDRKRPLEVVGFHDRKRTTRTAYRKEADKHRVVELEGNGTRYHLLGTEGSTVGPMLYKESSWKKDKEDKLGQTPTYNHGERVEDIEIV